MSLVSYFDKTYQPILLIFNSKQIKSTFYLVSKFEDNQSKITTVRVPERKSAKWPLLRHQIQNFKNRENMTLANILKIICVKFHQNRSIRLGCRDDTDRQTHTQTDAHTPWVRFQHIQSK